MTGCWFARTFGSIIGPCSGRLVKAHLLPKEKLGREGVENVWHPALWVWACGGPMGNGGHHGDFDSWKIAVPAARLPPALLEWAREHELEWMIDWRFRRTGWT